MEYKHLKYEEVERVAILTINRPSKMNALNSEVISEMRDILENVSNRSDLIALIFTGAGDKAFAAGADISEFVQLGLKDGFDFTRKGHRLLREIEWLSIPTIAAVNGMALGGGCELALACNFRLVSENAIFGLPELALGVIPGYGGTQRLARIIGKSRALWAILTGETIGAEEAVRIGLANKMIARESLLTEATKAALSIGKKGPLAVKAALIAVRHGFESDLESGLVLESAMENIVMASEDKREGVAAFLEKRKPVFKGQ